MTATPEGRYDLPSLACDKGHEFYVSAYEAPNKVVLDRRVGPYLTRVMPDGSLVYD